MGYNRSFMFLNDTEMTKKVKNKIERHLHNTEQITPIDVIKCTL